MQSVITAENIGKKYLLQHQKSLKYATLRDTMADTFKSGFRLLNPFSKKQQHGKSQEEFWALRDISLEIKEGERVGIIGRNGAGKSTLLKILSRITEPSVGHAKIRGRVASLLEVGTGFHPELTGRENIYLNGAILGMSRFEIKKKFDEIVAFAEIERFLDTPVKRYSSGMYVRLAFAVAAHLEPEILIVDEVLAVGDAQFQKKCMGKMEEVSTKEDRTILFVSHNMDAVIKLCSSAILLNNGIVQSSGRTDSVVDLYMREDIGCLPCKRWIPSEAPGSTIVRLLEIYVHDEDMIVGNNFDISCPIGISMQFEVLDGGHLLIPAFNFFNKSYTNIFDAHDSTLEWRRKSKQPGTYKSTVWIPGNFLSEGTIIVGAAIVISNPFEVHVHVKEVLTFNVVDLFKETSARGDYLGSFPGLIRPMLKWELAKV